MSASAVEPTHHTSRQQSFVLFLHSGKSFWCHLQAQSQAQGALAATVVRLLFKERIAVKRNEIFSNVAPHVEAAGFQSFLRHQLLHLLRSYQINTEIGIDIRHYPSPSRRTLTSNAHSHLMRFRSDVFKYRFLGNCDKL